MRLCELALGARRSTKLTGEEDPGNFTQDTEQDQEHAAEAACLTIRATCDGNDSVVLFHGTEGAETTHCQVQSITLRTCAKIDNGVTVNNAEKKPPIPSL